MSEKSEKLDLAAIRKRLEGASGRSFWRSLEELAGSKDFEEMMHREFPRYASEWESVEERRGFLKLMGASLALAGLSRSLTVIIVRRRAAARRRCRRSRR